MSSSPRILIVEDEANIRRFVGIALEDEGFQVFEADSVKRALIHAASRQPDLVIVDLGLPDGDGKQLISELRGWLAVPILVLSARDREAEKVAALTPEPTITWSSRSACRSCWRGFARNCAAMARVGRQRPPAR